jgi:hypothetical protein
MPTEVFSGSFETPHDWRREPEDAARSGASEVPHGQVAPVGAGYLSQLILVNPARC